jgi:uncharacterized protein YlzI (FlbEa/FlbD family)
MIRLTDLGTSGAGNGEPLDIDEKQISSLEADPVEASRTVVTMDSGTWFLVAESVSQIETLIAAAGM